MSNQGYTNPFNHLKSCIASANKEALLEVYKEKRKRSESNIGSFMSNPVVSKASDKDIKLHDLVQFIVKKYLPISVVEDKAYCDHAFKNYQYKFSCKYVSKVMLCLTELVEAMIAKEINVTKKGSILYNDWTKHGIHYIAIYACYYVFIKIR